MSKPDRLKGFNFLMSGLQSNLGEGEGALTGPPPPTPLPPSSIAEGKSNPFGTIIPPNPTTRPPIPENLVKVTPSQIPPEEIPPAPLNRSLERVDKEDAPVREVLNPILAPPTAPTRETSPQENWRTSADVSEREFKLPHAQIIQEVSKRKPVRGPKTRVDVSSEAFNRLSEISTKASIMRKSWVNRSSILQWLLESKLPKPSKSFLMDSISPLNSLGEVSSPTAFTQEFSIPTWFKTLKYDKDLGRTTAIQVTMTPYLACQIKEFTTRGFTFKQVVDILISNYLPKSERQYEVRRSQ